MLWFEFHNGRKARLLRIIKYIEQYMSNVNAENINAKF